MTDLSESLQNDELRADNAPHEKRCGAKLQCIMWYVYLARCRDGTIYTGITTDPERRELEHNTSKTFGAKSLRGKRPVKIVYTETYGTQNEARKREFEIKSWKRIYKLKLIAGYTRI